MIRAFTQTREEDDISIIKGFLLYDAAWLENSVITSERFEEIKSILKQTAYKAISDKMLENINQPRQRVLCIRRLLEYLRRSNKLLHTFSDDREEDAGVAIAYQLTNHMYNPIIQYNNEKIYDVIALLLGALFEKTFTKEELDANNTCLQGINR